MLTSLVASLRLTTAAITLAVAAVGVAAPIGVAAGGLANCVDLTGKNAARVGCYEDVWVDGEQVRMTFSNTSFDGATPKELPPFYVLAPQTAAPQGPMATFPHDHVIAAAPAKNKGTYGTKYQGFFVLCTRQGLVSGACDATWMTPPGAGGDLPFAHTVDGHRLTSTEAIEAFAADGDLALIDLGPGVVIVGSVTGPR